MKSIKNIFIGLVLIFNFTYALEEGNIESEMTKKMDSVLNILEKKDISIDEKNSKIIEIMDEVFDYDLMAKIALGSNLKKFSIEQFSEFKSVFEEMLKKSYNDKLHLYNDQKVKILGLESYKKTRLQLKTKLVGADETYDINYNFYKNKENQWFIYDVELIGVSILQTYRQQFTTLFASKDVDEVIKELKKQ